MAKAPLLIHIPALCSPVLSLHSEVGLEMAPHRLSQCSILSWAQKNHHKLVSKALEPYPRWVRRIFQAQAADLQCWRLICLPSSWLQRKRLLLQPFLLIRPPCKAFPSFPYQSIVSLSLVTTSHLFIFLEKN